jgi:hypothetical protein
VVTVGAWLRAHIPPLPRNVKEPFIGGMPMESIRGVCLLQLKLCQKRLDEMDFRKIQSLIISYPGLTQKSFTV